MSRFVLKQFSEPMDWSDNNCIKPDAIAAVGYVSGDNPAAEHENYFRRQTYICLSELQYYAVVDTGLCGENVFYLLRYGGESSISGTGSIAERAFIGNEKMKTADIQISGKLGADAFTGCTYLSSVNVNCTEIGNQSFSMCPRLRTIKLGKNISQIGTAILDGTPTIVSNTIVEYAGTVAEWNAIQKDSDWAYGSNIANHEVVCTDGTVPIV